MLITKIPNDMWSIIQQYLSLQELINLSNSNKDIYYSLNKVVIKNYKTNTYNNALKMIQRFSKIKIQLINNYNYYIFNKHLKKIGNNLTLLYFYNNKITNKGLKYILNLTTFYLCKNNKITNKGLKYVPKLTSLNLNSNKTITNEELKYIPNCIVIR